MCMKSKDIVTYLYAPHSPATFPSNYCNPAKHVGGLTPSGAGTLSTLYQNGYCTEQLLQSCWGVTRITCKCNVA